MKINTSKIIFAVLAGVCCFFKTFAQKEKERVTKYVEQYKELAIAEMLRTGIPASITLAQGVLETGNGQSNLALNANNHFGIKCKAGWSGATILHDDDAKGECFRKYVSVEDSYKDHSDFLKGRPNYASLFALDPLDYKGWAKGLKSAGYATSPTYAERLTQIVEENNLQQYTLLALEGNIRATNVATINEAPVNNNPAVAKELGFERKSVFAPGPVLLEQTNKKSLYPTGLFTINDTKVMYAEAGTSLLAMANNYSITYSKLIEFNELGNNDILPADQLIFLERKPKKGSTEFHTVTINETLYEICQKEGVQLASVLEYNHLQKGMTPAVGERLYLKIKAGSSPRLAMENRVSNASM